MVGTVNAERNSRALEFGMYRDGDNNLDEVQAVTIGQALQTSKADHSIEFTVEDTTARRGFEPEHVLRTESYNITDGKISKNVDVSAPHDMSACNRRTAMPASCAKTTSRAPLPTASRSTHKNIPKTPAAKSMAWSRINA